MTVHRSKIEFDSTGEVLIKGKIGGREVEYSGQVKEIDVAVDDGIDEWNWYLHSRDLVTETTTYCFAFECVDGKAITAKIGKLLVSKSATVPTAPNSGKTVEDARIIAGAPVDAKHEFLFSSNEVKFTWTEYV